VTFASNVAPRRLIRQLPTEQWFCRCPVPVCCGHFTEQGECCGDPDPEPKLNPPRLVNCPDCGERRP
jgi:hypothetical protein